MAEHKPLKREFMVKIKFCCTQVWGQSCVRAVEEQEVQDLQTDRPTERWYSYNTTGYCVKVWIECNSQVLEVKNLFILSLEKQIFNNSIECLIPKYLVMSCNVHNSQMREDTIETQQKSRAVAANSHDALQIRIIKVN